ncbi:TatD family hydrolase [Helicobacter sp. 23-1045]
MKFIDTHCHLDSADFVGDLDEILESCADLGVEKMLIPGADLADLPKAISLAEKYAQIYFSVGIHPNEIHTLNSHTLQTLHKSANHKKCLAVGEIGLDYHYKNDEATKNAQERGFRAQIELAIALNMPIIIHTRQSNADIVRILRDYESALKCVVFHCFGGDMNLVNALKCPCYYGIGGVISFKNAKSLHESAPKLPLEGIVLETDAPYLAPTPYRGTRNAPTFIPLIAEHLANHLHLSVEKISEISTANAERVFGFCD